MKFKEGFTLREVVGESVLMAEGINNVNFNKMIVLNDTAKFLWEELKDKEFTEDDAVKVLLDNYEVEEEKAREDVKNLFEQFEKAGILE